MSRPSRRKAREAALQLLYQLDLTGTRDEATFAAYWQSWPDEDQDERTREFAETLVRFVLEDETRIDAAIDAAAKNWDIGRFSRVDLSLLRLAVGELFSSPEVPAPVVIIEAVEIAHRFSDGRSASFINGVLDRVARDAGRIGKSPSASKASASSAASKPKAKAE